MTPRRTLIAKKTLRRLQSQVRKRKSLQREDAEGATILLRDLGSMTDSLKSLRRSMEIDAITSNLSYLKLLLRQRQRLLLFNLSNSLLLLLK
jgi:hypothetical protein